MPECSCLNCKCISAFVLLHSLIEISDLNKRHALRRRDASVDLFINKRVHVSEQSFVFQPKS